MSGRLLLRAFTVSFGLAAIAWAGDTFPKFRQQEPVIAAAERLVNGEHYSEAAIASLEASADAIAGPTPEVLGSLSILRQFLAEQAMARGEPSQDRLSDAKVAISHALMVAPADSYQWLSLFWVSLQVATFQHESLRSLDMSYATGPYEAWVALRRSPLALRLYPVLTPQLQNAALEEFSGLVRSHLYTQAATIAAAATPNMRKIIAARLGGLPLSDRQAFAKAADVSGITDMVVPGVEVEPLRPWRQ